MASHGYLWSTNSFSWILYYSCYLGDFNYNIIELQNEKITVFPNPTNGKLTIKGDKIQQVILFDISGHIINKSCDNNIDFTGYSKGIYFIEIHSNRGISTFKIIHE